MSAFRLGLSLNGSLAPGYEHHVSRAIRVLAPRRLWQVLVDTLDTRWRPDMVDSVGHPACAVRLTAAEAENRDIQTKTKTKNKNVNFNKL